MSARTYKFSAKIALVRNNETRLYRFLETACFDVEKSPQFVLGRDKVMKSAFTNNKVDLQEAVDSFMEMRYDNNIQPDLIEHGDHQLVYDFVNEKYDSWHAKRHGWAA